MKRIAQGFLGALIVLASGNVAVAYEAPDPTSFKYLNASWIEVSSINYIGSCGFRCKEYYVNACTGANGPGYATRYRVAWDLNDTTYYDAEMKDKDLVEVFDYYDATKAITYSETVDQGDLAWSDDQDNSDIIVDIVTYSGSGHLTLWYETRIYVHRVFC